MADVNKTIQISYEANIGALERALKRIPGITEQQMKKAINEVEKELKQAERAAEKTSKSFKDKFSKMSKSASIAGAAIAGAGYAMLEFGQRVADATNDLVDTSTKTGIAAETLQGLKIAAEGSGLAFEQFIGPLQRLQFLMVEANKENKTATKLFDDLGLQVKDTNGEMKSADSVFREMMNILGDMESPLERNALLMRAFGKQGAMFAQSGAVGALDEFVQLGREFGVDVGPEAVKQAADFQRAMADMSAVGTGAMQDILMAITGTNGMTAAVDEATASIITFKELFISAFKVISIPVVSLTHQVNALHLALTGDFSGAGDEIAASFQNAEQVFMDVFDIVGNVENQLVSLRKARNAIRKQNDENANQESKNNKTSERETNKKIEQIKKVVEVRRTDLEALKQINSLTAKLNESQKNLYDDLFTSEDKVTNAHKKRLEQYDAEIKAANLRYIEEQHALIELHNAKQITEEEGMERLAAIEQEVLGVIDAANDAKLASHARLQRDISTIEREQIEESLEMQRQKNQQMVDDMRNVVSQITSAFIDIQDNAVNHFVTNRDQAIENINQMEKAGVLSAEKSAEQREQIENAYQKSIEKQMLKSFRMKQATAITGILIDMAQASARAFVDYPFPASVGIAALSAGKAGLELAAVQSQTPPKFDVGGMIGQSDPLAPDQTQAQLLTGEAVLDRATVQRLGGEQGIRELQNAPQQNVVVIQPFKHFDRFISAGEKRGRFGIKRASGRY